MKQFAIGVLLFFSLAQPARSTEAVSTEFNHAKFPFGLLTSDYGIVTVDDLAYDATHRQISPYDPNESLGSIHWQCFPVDQVKATYDTWRGNDGMAEWNKNYSMCSLEIQVKHAGEIQRYVGRRAHQIGFCLDFINAWKRITKNQTAVCLNGDGGGYQKDDKDGKYKLWTWEKFKTKQGCYSYFAGYCNTNGCSTGKCPRS